LIAIAVSAKSIKARNLFFITGLFWCKNGFSYQLFYKYTFHFHLCYF